MCQSCQAASPIPTVVVPTVQVPVSRVAGSSGSSSGSVGKSQYTTTTAPNVITTTGVLWPSSGQGSNATHVEPLAAISAVRAIGEFMEITKGFNDQKRMLLNALGFDILSSRRSLAALGAATSQTNLTGILTALAGPVGELSDETVEVALVLQRDGFRGSCEELFATAARLAE